MRKRNLPVLSHCSPGKNTVPPVLAEFFSSNVQCDPSKIKKNKVENLIKRIALSQCLQFLGSYALLTDPLVRDNLVSQRVSHFEEEMTRDRYTLADWVLVLNFESLFSSCLVGRCFWLLFINCSRFHCVGKMLKSFPSQI